MKLSPIDNAGTLNSIFYIVSSRTTYHLYFKEYLLIMMLFFHVIVWRVLCHNR